MLGCEICEELNMAAPCWNVCIDPSHREFHDMCPNPKLQSIDSQFFHSMWVTNGCANSSSSDLIVTFDVSTFVNLLMIQSPSNYFSTTYFTSITLIFVIIQLFLTLLLPKSVNGSRLLCQSKHLQLLFDQNFWKFSMSSWHYSFTAIIF